MPDNGTNQLSGAKRSGTSVSSFGLYGQTYANDLEVQRGEYDARLHFYRKHDESLRESVGEITIPLALLDRLSGKG